MAHFKKRDHFPFYSLILLGLFLGLSCPANSQTLNSKVDLESTLKAIPLSKKLNLSVELKQGVDTQGQDKFLSSFKIIGQITGIELGDYAHLKFQSSDGSQHSYFCLGDICNPYLAPQKPSFPIHALLEIHEIERITSETGEPHRMAKVGKILRLGTAPKIHSCTKYSKLPAVFEGCEGEACGILTYQRNTMPLSLYSKPEKGLAPSQTLASCSEIQNHKFFIKHNTQGKALVVEPTSTLSALGVNKGHVIPVVSSIGEGFVDVCIGDKTTMAYSSTGPSGSGAVEPIVEIIDYPHNEAWLQVELGKTKSWINLDESNNALMGYYSYEPHKLCPQDHPLGPKKEENQSTIRELLNTELASQCKKHGSCVRKDPTSSCPLVGELSDSLLPKIQTIGQLKQCAALDVSENICSPNTDLTSEIRIPMVYFSCVFRSDRKELQDRLQMSFSYSCPSTKKGFDCKGSYHEQ